jgi:hypothetical protein
MHHNMHMALQVQLGYQDFCSASVPGHLKISPYFPELSSHSLSTSLEMELKRHVGTTIRRVSLNSESHILSKWPLKAKDSRHFVRKEDPELVARELAEILDRSNLQDTASYIRGKRSS